MKTKIISILLFLSAYSVFGQISTNEKPIGLKLHLETKSIQEAREIQEIARPNISKLHKEDKEDEENGIPPRFGYPNKVNFTPNNSGKWLALKNGDKLWQLNIQAKGALSLNLLYDKFWLPKGGKLFIYDKDGKHSIGAFTSINNTGTKEESKGFATGLVYSDNIIVEYYQPAEVKEKAIISIAYVVYGYRYINTPNKGGLGASGDCQLNINCKEGQNWQKEKEAVALILVGGTRWCTGSLINTTAEDLRPLFLTANHCLEGNDAINSPNLPYYSFYWHYEAPTCSNSNIEPPRYSTVGATIKANNPVSDFALFELTEDPRKLNAFTPYYLGWDRKGTPFTGAVGIHHPNGDVKKISIENNLVNETSYLGNLGTTHWKVIWDKGVTEHISSGSPLFNLEKRIVGQLHGGWADCKEKYEYGQKYGPNEPDWYGCFHVSWTGNNDPDKRRRLKDWLDPNNTGAEVLDGTDGTSNIVPPTNLTATNIRYTDFTLNWDTVNKAVGYEIYVVTDSSKEKLIGTTTEKKLHIKDLEMGKTYEYAVKAKYHNGVSEYSETLSVTTEYTRIVGEPMICKQESYTIEKLLPNTTVKWRTSNNNLELVSGQGTATATFTKRKDGECKIIANIEDGTQILTEEVYVGVPLTAEMEVTLNNEIVYDNAISNLPTLYSDELNVLEVKPVSDPPFYHESPIPFSVFSVASYPFVYEWRIKSHAYYWDFYDFTRKKDDVLNNKAYVKYEDVDNGAIPFAFFKPIFQVRKYNNCGCSEWKDIENFNVKYPYQNNSVYYFLSPNGDGANDTFEIVQEQAQQPTLQTYNNSSKTSVFNLTIFNKNGEIVYQKENYMQDTERFYGVGNVGSFKGTELPNGDYFFRITGSENRSGNIYIKRE